MELIVINSQSYQAILVNCKFEKIHVLFEAFYANLDQLESLQLMIDIIMERDDENDP